MLYREEAHAGNHLDLGNRHLEFLLALTGAGAKGEWAAMINGRL